MNAEGIEHFSVPSKSSGMATYFASKNPYLVPRKHAFSPKIESARVHVNTENSFSILEK